MLTQEVKNKILQLFIFIKSIRDLAKNNEENDSSLGMYSVSQPAVLLFTSPSGHIVNICMLLSGLLD